MGKLLSQLPLNEPLNEEVLTLISSLIWEVVEDSSEYRQVMDEFVKAVGAVHEKMGIAIVRDLENAPLGVAILYGEAMFRLGLAIGSDPSLLLRLPRGKHMR